MAQSRRRLSDFVGTWHLARDIDDWLSGAPARLEGSAALTASGIGATYEETGTLRLGTGPSVAARRRYLWRDVGHEIAVAFADGRPFHSFDPGEAQPEAEHLCGADLYRVRYDFTAWPVWRAVWEVRGPRKDYRLVSVYTT